MTPDELKMTRKTLGMTIQELAEYCEVEDRAVRRWESGVNQIPHDFVLRCLCELIHESSITAEGVGMQLAERAKREFAPFTITFRKVERVPLSMYQATIARAMLSEGFMFVHDTFITDDRDEVTITIMERESEASE